jgi:hypothetical protein
MNLENTKISYLLISSDKLNDIISVLYSRDYQILEMKNYESGSFNDSILAYGTIDNDLLRNDIVFLLDKFNIEYVIAKYKGETKPRKIFNIGSEKILSVTKYNENSESSYIYKGMSFSFFEEKRYWIPKQKEDFRVGMIVEYFNNNQWNEKLVENPNEEWDNIYKLMLKYNKIRIQSRN